MSSIAAFKECKETSSHSIHVFESAVASKELDRVCVCVCGGGGGGDLY